MTEETTDQQQWPDLAGKMLVDRHILAVRVYYEDTDFSGYVYHANYLKFCERGRTDVLRQIGIHHSNLADANPNDVAAFVVSRMECDFIKPARIDDVLEINTWFLSAKGARMFLRQEVYCNGVLLFKAAVTAALIDGNGRPKRFPPDMLAAFSRADIDSK